MGEEALLQLLFEGDFVRAGRAQVRGVRVGMLCSCESLFRDSGFLERPGFASTYLRCVEELETETEDAEEDESPDQIKQLCFLRSQLVQCYQQLSLSASSSQAFSYHVSPPAQSTSTMHPLLRCCVYESRMLLYIQQSREAMLQHLMPGALSALSLARSSLDRWLAFAPRKAAKRHARLRFLTRLYADLAARLHVEFQLQPAPEDTPSLKMSNFSAYTQSAVRQLYFQNVSISCCCLILDTSHSSVALGPGPYAAPEVRPEPPQGIASYPIIWAPVPEPELHPTLVSMIMSIQQRVRPVVHFDSALQSTLCLCAVDEARTLCIAAKGVRKLEPATPLLQLGLTLVAGLTLRAARSQLVELK